MWGNPLFLRNATDIYRPTDNHGNEIKHSEPKLWSGHTQFSFPCVQNTRKGCWLGKECQCRKWWVVGSWRNFTICWKYLTISLNQSTALPSTLLVMMGDSAKPVIVINRRHLPKGESELQVGTGVGKIITTLTMKSQVQYFHISPHLKVGLREHCFLFLFPCYLWLSALWAIAVEFRGVGVWRWRWLQHRIGSLHRKTSDKHQTFSPVQAETRPQFWLNLYLK